MRRFITTLALIILIGPSVALGEANCEKHLPLGKLPGADQVFCYDGYAVGYAHDLKIPVWAAYLITDQSANGANVERQDNFRENPEVPAQFMSKKSDYRGSGFDRGHMAPSGSIDYSGAANSDTFYLSNMVPQRPGFNRDGFGHEGVWGYLENQARDWVAERGSIYVVSGAIATGNQTIGEGVAVPEAFYKVMLDLKTGESISFLMPHKDDLRGDVESFITSIDRIEEISKLDLFQRVVDEQEKRLESFIAPGMW